MPVGKGGQMRAVPDIAWALLAAVFLIVSPAVSGAQPVFEKIALSYPSVTSTGGLVPWIAKERGFLSAQGVHAELIYTSGALSMQALLGGSVDLVLGSIFDPLSAIAGGADVVVLGSFNNTAPYVMAVRPEIREVRDLRGRKVGVRSLTGPATAMTQFLLEEAGLDSKRDVQILRVGGTAARLAALQDGQVDAALIDEAVAHRAKQSGLNIIHLKGIPHIHTGIYARRAGLQQREAALASAIRGLREGAVYMKTNKPGSVQVVQKIMKVSDPKVAETSYEILKDSVETDPRVPPNVIQQSLKLASRNDPRVKNVDSGRAFDMRLAARSMESRK
jgi:ABC-type nitrate/sulfonate/bicarbonate transport system substrate-binding protein